MFAAPSVNVALLDIVNVEIGVAIGSDTVTFPAPTKSMVGVPDEAPNAEPDATSNVNVPAVLPIDEFAASVTAPVMVFEFATLTIAPVDEIPVPDTVNGSPIERFVPDTFTAAPELIVVPADAAPNPLLLLTVTAPALMEIEPEYDELAPESVSVPEPDFVRATEPETAPEIVAETDDAT